MNSRTWEREKIPLLLQGGSGEGGKKRGKKGAATTATPVIKERIKEISWRKSVAGFLCFTLSAECQGFAAVKDSESSRAGAYRELISLGFGPEHKMSDVASQLL